MHKQKNYFKTTKNIFKTTWKLMEKVGISKIYHDNFAKSLCISVSITDKNNIGAKFNAFIVNAYSSLGTKMPPSDKHFRAYLPNISNILNEQSLDKQVFKKCFSLKTSKKPGYYNINVNITKEI